VKPLNRFIRVGLSLVIVSVAMISSSAQASLVFAGLLSGSGAGIGASNVILTVNNSGTESGCVAWNGTTDVIGSAACPTLGISPAIPGGNEQTGSSQTQTQTLTATGVSSGSYLTVILNANEPAGNAITVDNLSLTIYDSITGAVLFNSGNLFGAPITISSTMQGQGNLGFGFVLDAAQAAAANPFITCPSCGANRIGIAALLSDSQGSNETFSVIYLTPEPYTLLTFAGGLIAIGLFRRFKRPNRSIE
jgi:hypothetical protein